jgi:hypothetical protein
MTWDFDLRLRRLASSSEKPIHLLWDGSLITDLTSFTAAAWGEGVESGAALALLLA